jgi:hypothetical protein
MHSVKQEGTKSNSGSKQNIAQAESNETESNVRSSSEDNLKSSNSKLMQDKSPYSSNANISSSMHSVKHEGTKSNSGSKQNIAQTECYDTESNVFLSLNDNILSSNNEYMVADSKLVSFGSKDNLKSSQVDTLIKDEIELGLMPESNIDIKNNETMNAMFYSKDNLNATVIEVLNQDITENDVEVKAIAVNEPVARFGLIVVEDTNGDSMEILSSTVGNVENDDILMNDRETSTMKGKRLNNFRELCFGKFK